MRILHTSDWHLGVSTGPVSRLTEQERFLSWLHKTISREAVDTLVVAGDIFDSMQPSAEAQAAYYRFLARVEGSGLRQVVVVGGNHDSPARLDAPAHVLQALSVHVVGGHSALERMLVPLKARGADAVAAVCLAVPYVHEYRLGVRTTMVDPNVARGRFRGAFKKLYTDLVDAAEEQWPGVPIIATGHLTMSPQGGEEALDGTDYPQEIHQVGTLHAMPASILDPRLAYVALGHIHRSYPVRQDPAAWYCGTPIPYSLKEAQSARYVLIAELGEQVAVRRLEVPVDRTLVRLVGDRQDVVTQLKGLNWSDPMPPLVHAHVRVETTELGLNAQLHEAVSAHPEDRRPVLVEIKQMRAGAAPAPGTDITGGRTLAELDPSEVFAMLCEHKSIEGETRAALEQAFSEVAQATDSVLAEMLAGVEVPAEGDA